MASPKVWSKFEVTNKNGAVEKFRIQAAQKPLSNDIKQFYMTHIEDDVFQKAAGIYNSAEALKEAQTIVEGMMEDPQLEVLICCSDTEPGTKNIIAAFPLKLSESSDEAAKELSEVMSQVKTPEMKKYGEIVSGLSLNMVKVLPKDLLQKCYDYRGGVIHADYRNEVVVTEGLKAIRKLRKEKGVPVTLGWATSLPAQQSAEANGLETAYEVSFDELSSLFGVTFEGAPPTFKLMVDRA